MHPELNSSIERRQALIEKMNASGAFDPKSYDELQALQKRIDVMESHAGPEPYPDQPCLELEPEPKAKRAART